MGLFVWYLPLSLSSLILQLSIYVNSSKLPTIATTKNYQIVEQVNHEPGHKKCKKNMTYVNLCVLFIPNMKMSIIIEIAFVFISILLHLMFIICCCCAIIKLQFKTGSNFLTGTSVNQNILHGLSNAAQDPIWIWTEKERQEIKF